MVMNKGEHNVDAVKFHIKNGTGIAECAVMNEFMGKPNLRSCINFDSGMFKALSVGVGGAKGSACCMTVSYPTGE